MADRGRIVEKSYVVELLKKELVSKKATSSVVLPDSELKRAIVSMRQKAVSSMSEIPTDTKHIEPLMELERLVNSIDTEIKDTYGETGLVTGLEEIVVSKAPEEQEQFLVFDLADSRYAISIFNIIEVGRVLPVTYVPSLPHWILGVTNVRGDIISVVDLRSYFGMERTRWAESTRMLLAKKIEGEIIIALAVDGLSQMMYMEKRAILTPSGPVDDDLAQYLRGLYQHETGMVAVLDIEKLLSSLELRPLV